MNEKISIIIPCREINEQTIKCIRECLNLDYEDFEILVLPDFTSKKSKNNRLRIIETGKVKPSFKRNKGMALASGEFFAFIDDDAYPRRDWLKNAVKYFRDEKIGIVGGPNLTPREGNFAEHVSGHVLSNFLTSGDACIRYKVAKSQYAKELPSCNYLSRKLGIEYASNFLTAEDSKFCFDYQKKGYKVLYVDDVIVHHHRRDSLWKHLKQMFIYGRDIAWLTKKEFSWDKLYYSLLSLFVIGFFAGLIWSFFNVFIRAGFLFALGFYLLLMLFTSFHESLKMSWFVFIISIATHFAYGIGWLKGIFSSAEKTAEVSWVSR